VKLELACLGMKLCNQYRTSTTVLVKIQLKNISYACALYAREQLQSGDVTHEQKWAALLLLSMCSCFPYHFPSTDSGPYDRTSLQPPTT